MKQFSNLKSKHIQFKYLNQRNVSKQLRETKRKILVRAKTRYLKFDFVKEVESQNSPNHSIFHAFVLSQILSTSLE